MNELNTGFYYWTHNVYGVHFIVFRHPHDRGKIQAKVKPMEDGTHEYTVTGPEWLTVNRTHKGTCQTLVEAMREATQHIRWHTERAFRKEYVPPLG